MKVELFGVRKWKWKVKVGIVVERRKWKGRDVGKWN